MGKSDPAPRSTRAARLRILRLVVFFLLASLLMQADTFAPSRAAATAPTPPAEKLLCQYGQWETEYWDDSGMLAYQYIGDPNPQVAPAPGNAGKADFTIGKATLLTVIIDVHLNPNVDATHVEIASPGSLALVDDAGNYYGPYEASVTSAVNNGKADATLLWAAPVDHVELAPGHYRVIDSDPASMLVNTQSLGVPATIVKGVDAQAYANYMDALVAASEPEVTGLPQATNPSDKPAGAVKVTYSKPQVLVDNPPDPSLSVYPANSPSFPCAFVITEPMMVTKIMDYHINNGKGAQPGMIGLQEHGGTWYGSWHAYGQAVNGIPNAIWVVTPNFEIPAGSYQVRDNETSTLSADANNRAMCELKVAPAVTTLLDNVSGKYTINFSLDDGSSVDYPLVLGIIDHKNRIEIGTIIAEQPLKFNAAVSDRTNGVVKASFSQGFSDFNIAVAMTFTKKADSYVLTGRVTVLSNDSAGISFSGSRTSTDLPGFIPQPHAGIGKVGSIPGPGSAGQAAAGIAFPTLATLLAAAVASGGRGGGRGGGGNSGFYANTGDGENGGGEAGTYSSSEDTGSPEGSIEEAGSEYSGSATGTDTGGMDTGASAGGSIPDSSGTGTDTGGLGTTSQAPQPVPAAPAPAPQTGPQNGESMTVHDPGDGLDKTYVYHEDTGEWINPLTGGMYIADNYAASAKAHAETVAEGIKRAETDANALADGPTKWLGGSTTAATLVGGGFGSAAAATTGSAGPSGAGSAGDAGSTGAATPSAPAATPGPDPDSIYPPDPANAGGTSSLKDPKTSGKPDPVLTPYQKAMIGLKNDMANIDKSLKDQNIYVINKLQGDPILVFQGLEWLGDKAWDNTVGRVTGSQGLSCEGYVSKTMDAVKASVQKQFPGATVERGIFLEKSTYDPQGVLDYIDAKNDDNHTFIKVTLPDGEQLAVDFHGANASNFKTNPPVVRPYEELKNEWKTYMGDEFMES